mmetsp:Transcript_146755/g.256012  ORF Transcript_146755/g.256012 Transcript_146755/m.256012 type:complete len:116 (-) Transcript_146755:955-1302(-)
MQKVQETLDRETPQALPEGKGSQHHLSEALNRLDRASLEKAQGSPIAHQAQTARAATQGAVAAPTREEVALQSQEEVAPHLEEDLAAQVAVAAVPIQEQVRAPECHRQGHLPAPD